MKIETYNPFTGERISEYEEFNASRVREIISSVRERQRGWATDIDQRIDYLRNTLKRNLEISRTKLAKLMSSEMGKPVSQSLAEIDKCIRLIDYACSTYVRYLESEDVETEAKHSYVRFDPLGVILLVMPWNFPLWQTMRAAVPAMLAGNGIVLKHASIVTGSSLEIERIFESEVFRSLILRGSSTGEFIKYVDGVSFTGSTEAGRSVANEAGRHLKKTVLELGGSDPFIVLKDADLEESAEGAVFGRLQNNGQSCIASKRILVHSDIYEEFVRILADKFEKVKMGDPLKPETFLGPVSSKEQERRVRNQIERLSGIGKVESFGKTSGVIIPPTLALVDEPFNEEVFGPVAILRKFSSDEEAVKLANETPYGLGCSIWGDTATAERMIPKIEAGMVFVNRVVISDPRIPFGGVKESGYGRELSKFGLREFTNIKTVWIDH
ncbi:MAG: aldehyde dehydrogenase family protein [Candidatus Thermoplasmatota archaeon]|nr:aldehyde dehydrogenase family protein [Candidatus Thermoplasmatota archaeon]